MLKISIPISALRAIQRFTAAKLDPRGYLRCVLVEQTQDALYVVGCDGMSLGVVTMPNKGNSKLERGEKNQVLFNPFQYKRELNKQIYRGYGPQEVQIQELKEQVKLTYGDEDYLCDKFVDCKYPEWRRIMPRADETAGMTADINLLSLPRLYETLFFDEQGKATKKLEVLKQIEFFRVNKDIVAFEQPYLEPYSLRGIQSTLRYKDDRNKRQFSETFNQWNNALLAKSTETEEMKEAA